MLPCLLCWLYHTEPTESKNSLCFFHTMRINVGRYLRRHDLTNRCRAPSPLVECCYGFRHRMKDRRRNLTNRCRAPGPSAHKHIGILITRLHRLWCFPEFHLCGLPFCPPETVQKLIFMQVQPPKIANFPRTPSLRSSHFSPLFPSQLPFMPPVLHAAHFVCNPMAEEGGRRGKEGDEGGRHLKIFVQKLFAKTLPPFLVLLKPVEWLTTALLHESP